MCACCVVYVLLIVVVEVYTLVIDEVVRLLIIRIVVVLVSLWLRGAPSLALLRIASPTSHAVFLVAGRIVEALVLRLIVKASTLLKIYIGLPLGLVVPPLTLGALVATLVRLIPPALLLPV